MASTMTKFIFSFFSSCKDSLTDVSPKTKQVWDLLEGKRLFTKSQPSREASRGEHLARMVSLLGKPPKDFLERSEYWSEFFDDDGNSDSFPL